MKLQFLSLLGTALIVGGTSTAEAALYAFQFTSDGDIGSTGFFDFTDVGGVVKGSLELPDGDGTFLPTNVTITEYPAAHGSEIFTNLIATTWPQLGTGFTVSGGSITGADWAAQIGITSTNPLEGFDQIRFNFRGLNVFTLSGAPGQATINDDGFAGVAYSNFSSIPEPTSVLGLAGVLGLAFTSHRRRR